MHTPIPIAGRWLDNFNCRIRKGEHVGFRGASGAGKSTLFNLLAGLLEPDSGEIRIDGVLLNGMTRASWMRRLGYVPQEVFIFNGTLAENIALGYGTIDYGRVKELLGQVCLGRWAEALPDGMDTLLGEAGGRLSVAETAYRHCPRTLQAGGGPAAGRGDIGTRQCDGKGGERNPSAN